MERQIVGFKVNQEALMQQIEFDQNELSRQDAPTWWAEVMIDDMSYCSQMLCGVRPYQWDFQKAVK